MDTVIARRVNDRAIEGLGTSEPAWLRWPGLARLPVASAADLVPAGARVVVVAPHPDDEVLASGGLLSLLGRGRTQVQWIAVTDGTRSHHGSTEWTAERLQRERPQESRQALQQLGLRDLEPIRLRLPDGEVRRDILAAALQPLLLPGDVIVTTWRHDGHTDHDQTGAGCALAARRAGARLLEVPVWAWHWAVPGDTRIPWQRARRLLLDADASRRKQSAVQCFQSQLQPDASTGAGPILRSTTVARAARPFEVFFA
ncbi:PIG-L deacetylase family protein [Variovorax sp. PAMC 28711]|uniref:PIG-L deacetylase family protein n=1 Tax=Variovorax sp. PAMC 28711 TaxID=1795631 RepID=UPI00078C3206|nr:PIG-L family deacetylase [Variovorax sp. PAMC 28711]AMM23286.1 acetylglucosaminylphosphatidylinositol deacetylase [Variovorax sp. PAMC 28711]